MHYYNDRCFNMEIGDTFDYYGNTFEVCEPDKSGYCDGCYFSGKAMPCPKCACSEVVFKPLEKKED